MILVVGSQPSLGPKKNASWENIPRFKHTLISVRMLKEMSPKHFQVKSILGVII